VTTTDLVVPDRYVELAADAIYRSYPGLLKAGRPYCESIADLALTEAFAELRRQLLDLRALYGILDERDARLIRSVFDRILAMLDGAP
jgi:hypothetical protein